MDEPSGPTPDRAPDGHVDDAAVDGSIATAGGGGADDTAEPAAGGEGTSPGWSPTTKLVMAIALAGAIGWVLYIGRNVLTIAALAGLISYLVAPVIRLLHDRLRIPRVLALLGTYVALFFLLMGLGLFMATGVVRAASEIDVEKAEESLRSTAIDVLESLREFTAFGYTIDLSDAVDPLLEDLEDEQALQESGISPTSAAADEDTATSGTSGDGDSADPDTGDDADDSTATTVTTAVTGGGTDPPETAAPTTNGTGTGTGADADDSSADADSDDERRLALTSDQVRTLFGNVSAGFTTVGAAVAAFIMSFIITTLVAMYLNADSKKFNRAVRSAVPTGYESDVDNMANRIGGIWRGYLFGQLLNSAITGIMVGAVLWGVGLPGAFVWGLLTGLLNMIPTFGPILAAIPGVLVAFALGSTRFDDMSNLMFALVVVGIYIVVVQLQANVIAPFITGRAVKLSPATVLLGLLLGVQMAGLVGAVLVVPVIATGKELGRYVFAKLNDIDPYPPKEGAEDDSDGDAGGDDGATSEAELAAASSS
ncbi:MAG: AI-2E family transporter [Acidimicrobiia bacterium]|nr:AI-2E family transporter [Acidimicrobiia bacterium]